MLREISVTTGKRNEMLDITGEIESAVSESGVREGVCHIFVPHTTAAVTINEKADPDVARDISSTLEKIVPAGWGYRHGEGNSDSHIKSSLVGSSEWTIITEGRLLLGVWQAVFFCEFDGPRKRKCYIRISKDG
ncbi:MAG: YjbQ family protein [Candidatus Krumholzibacteriota bacterium]|nr:YjbQ family protein [Candidatus Krumholzibacteriota bacterium]